MRGGCLVDMFGLAQQIGLTSRCPKHKLVLLCFLIDPLFFHDISGIIQSQVCVASSKMPLSISSSPVVGAIYVPFI